MQGRSGFLSKGSRSVALIKATLIVILIAFVLSGYFGRSITSLGYAQSLHHLEWGNLKSGLRGTVHVVDKKTSITASPYELLAIFSASKKDRKTSLVGCEVAMKNITLTDHDNPSNKRTIPSQRIAFKEQTGLYYNASFLINGLTLEYVDYRLSFDYNGIGTCAGLFKKSRIEILIKRNYQVEKKTFWHDLMAA